VRKSIVYSGITVTITAVFLSLLFGLNFLLRTSWSTPLGLVMTVGMVIILAWLFNPLRGALERGADRLFYGSKYDYRKTVLQLAHEMSNVIDLDELAKAMLRPITNAVSASQTSLLFASNGHFSTQFAERLVEGEPVVPIHIRKDGPIIKWLEREEQPLYRETIYTVPEFKGMWQEDRNTLDSAEIDLLCPIKSKHKLIAILALSRKQPRGYYCRDDTDLLMTLSHEAAVAIENAQLYDKAKQRANIDELTGLFNHRFFHERLDEEIARCSRFGYMFSLIFLDLDRFKNYNDVYGHLSGDKVLQFIGKQIDQSVRDIDICFRYGGDEFAILLPETPLEGASQVAERIRKGIEAQTELKGMLQTCSIGIASWPTDGVMREEIIQSADMALYSAKQTGGNRIYWSCDVAPLGASETGSAYNERGNNAILNTIYALAATVDAKDHHTYGHSKKVSLYAVDIARELGYSRQEIENIRAAALLHDIGKIGISDQLLSKREPLVPDDWDAIHTHPSLGVSILKHVDSLKGCLAAVLYHHERYDGSGYPAGLKGNNIPLDARILAVADAFDAMTSERPYRPGKATTEQALKELQRCAGTQFDPEIVNVFVSLKAQPSETAVETRSKARLQSTRNRSRTW
jgi:diguanylate cyclase (GGDEF)-like protein/putative nucleotidyltransferase with HDIG domain